MLKSSLAKVASLGLLLCSCSLTRNGADENLTLASGGKTNYEIVTAETNNPIDGFAAAELAKFLREVTGAEFKTVKASSPEAGQDTPRIFLGRRQDAAENLKDQECSVASKGHDLFLYGKGKYGNLYAVYEFLEKQLGCRWYTAYGDARIPKRPELAIKPVNSTVSYAFPVRGLSPSFFYNRRDEASLFLYRNRQNIMFPEMPGVETYKCEFPPTCHSLSCYIPSTDFANRNAALDWLKDKNYFKTNPEFFSLDEAGKRVPNNQLCFSNRELRKELTKNILEQLRREQAKKAGREGMISVDCNDIAYNLCYCPGCKKLQEQYKSPGGPLFDYLIELCGLMEKEHPDVMVKTLAYQATQTEIPPAAQKLPDNLIVIFAPINSNFLAPFDHPTNSSELKNLQGWSERCKNVWVWYYPNTYKDNKNFFVNPPVGNLDRIAEDVRTFKGLGVSGAYFEHDSGGLHYCANFSELQTWIMLQLFQNPDQELAPLITEFTDFYYGEAAPLMREHLYELEGLSQKLTKQNMRWRYNKLTFPYLTQENIARWQARFDRMEDLTKNSPDANFHVRLVRFGLDAAELTLFGTSWDKAAFDKRAQRLAKTFEELRAKRLPSYERMYIRKVDGTLDEWLAKMGKRTAIPPKGIPEEFKCLGKERVVMANPDYLELNVDKAAVKDADADLGMAIFEDTDGKDFQFGFYDAFNKKFGQSRTIKKAEIVPDTYKLYKLNGLVKLSPDCLLWGGTWRLSVKLGHLCPPDDPQALKDDWEVYASLKFEGPAYSAKTADKPNRALCDRVVLVKAKPTN